MGDAPRRSRSALNGADCYKADAEDEVRRRQERLDGQAKVKREREEEKQKQREFEAMAASKSAEPQGMRRMDSKRLLKQASALRFGNESKLLVGKQLDLFPGVFNEEFRRSAAQLFKRCAFQSGSYLLERG